ncbi:MAG TPA: ATPase [Gammaproteobacteria bacterium]|nr:ATPase [Gammaproteobacteria bacterium]|tara:strand:+ start:380 stop:1540 length:1161 start_codon:yes stop_codon:yes gene_type:complete
MMKPLYLFTLLSLLAPQVALTQNAKSSEELEAQIKAMESEIQKYKALLHNTKDEHSDLENDLEKSEKNVNELQKKIDTIETELTTGEDKVSRLETRQRELQLRKTEQQRHIEKQIQAAYKIGKQEYLKVALNQEDPNEISRMLTYYDYLNMARAAEVERFRSTLTQLETVTGNIAKENMQLQANHAALDRQRSQLQVEKDRKLIVLRSLNRRIAETGSELTKLATDRQRLERLLERIHITDIQVLDDSIPFESMKGQLMLPVAGTISQSFGADRNIGKMRWRGIFIDAPEGEPVHAVHYGRVVFSDWLRGFGLLLIVNHGKGYMSLYGHNQTINREAGDWVLVGETIATVGNTGGQNKTGLYFEIRIDGTPADPQRWCQTRAGRAA